MEGTAHNFDLNNIESFAIRNIDKNIRFWMVRTKKGYFYDEFINNRFIALGWNIITESTDLSEHGIELLKALITVEYGDSRPMGSINKCKSFIHEMQKGDYVIIPNSGSNEIAVAIVGEYFEDSNCNEENELEVIAKIENHEYEISQVKCPYKKRRYIEILNIVDVNTLSYNLRKAISSYHGISNFDAYAVDILNGVYDCYAYLNDMYLSINITKHGELKPREISRLLYALTEFFCVLVDEDSISTTINLNSPGAVRMKLKEGFKKIKKAKVSFVCMFLAVTGGSGFGFELPGLAGVIKEYRTMDIEIEQEKVNLETQKLELETKQEMLKEQKLENTRTMLEVLKEAEEQDIDIEELLKQLGLLQELDESLQFKTKENNCTEEEITTINVSEEKEE